MEQTDVFWGKTIAAAILYRELLEEAWAHFWLLGDLEKDTQLLLWKQKEGQTWCQEIRGYQLRHIDGAVPLQPEKLS
ncbi:uncharacterized protein LOC119564092 isoform X3 [Chelonia mydas]|uniref:uncharacterized protein LOC119564092 isoform X3 n=1 Tax=Chelonia mydas TaxID=8469 RepID=UPI001CA8A078|nr:uncharacterized protein LOC119564092 isoform X3 [Chelonia mydas]